MARNSSLPADSSSHHWEKPFCGPTTYEIAKKAVATEHFSELNWFFLINLFLASILRSSEIINDNFVVQVRISAFTASDF